MPRATIARIGRFTRHTRETARSRHTFDTSRRKATHGAQRFDSVVQLGAASERIGARASRGSHQFMVCQRSAQAHRLLVEAHAARTSARVPAASLLLILAAVIVLTSSPVVPSMASRRRSRGSQCGVTGAVASPSQPRLRTRSPSASTIRRHRSRARVPPALHARPGGPGARSMSSSRGMRVAFQATPSSPRRTSRPPGRGETGSTSRSAVRHYSTETPTISCSMRPALGQEPGLSPAASRR
jgi:hypothetical protein